MLQPYNTSVPSEMPRKPDALNSLTVDAAPDIHHFVDAGRIVHWKHLVLSKHPVLSGNSYRRNVRRISLPWSKLCYIMRLQLGLSD
jgi:hypothetical protein